MKTRTIRSMAVLLCTAICAAIFAVSGIHVRAETGYTYVYTPNNTAVFVWIPDEYSQSVLDGANAEKDMEYPNATRLASASARYNCHSYAWYLQSSSNPYWMDNPSAYYIDYSYEESTGNIGDIICYFAADGENLHSGVVVARQQGTPNGVCGDANLVTVVSKWGQYGLYQHQGDYCPYVSTHGGTAAYVKYYTIHVHAYSYNSLNSIYHTVTCSCGVQTTESHTLRVQQNGMYYHTKSCRYCDYSVMEAHNFVLSGLWYICSDCGYRHKATDGPIPQPYGLEPINA